MKCISIEDTIFQVAEKIQEELEEYRSKEDDIKRMKHEMGIDGQDEAAVGLLSDNTQVCGHYYNRVTIVAVIVIQIS